MASAADGAILYTMDSTEDQEISYANGFVVCTADTGFRGIPLTGSGQSRCLIMPAMPSVNNTGPSGQYESLKQGLCYFEARTLDENSVLLDEKGQVVFTGEKGDSFILLDENSLIVHNYEEK